MGNVNAFNRAAAKTQKQGDELNKKFARKLGLKIPLPSFVTRILRG